MKKIIALFLAIAVMLSLVFVLSSCGGEDDKGSVSITSVEVVDGQLIVTYSDGTVKNLGNAVPEELGTDGLLYHLLPDGTYGVTAGAAHSLETVIIPATHEGKAVTQIMESAFHGAKNIKNIVIPAGVTDIGKNAFAACISLTSVTIPDSVTSIGDKAFSYCSSLTSIIIPDGITEISARAFYRCTGLTNVTIPVSVTSIDLYAFCHCTGLINITYNGTAAQWNAIEKGLYWSDDTGYYTITCTDYII